VDKSTFLHLNGWTQNSDGDWEKTVTFSSTFKLPAPVAAELQIMFDAGKVPPGCDAPARPNKR